MINLDVLECFKIQILKSKNENYLDIHNYEPVHQILCDRINVFAEPIMIAADPFLFVHNDRLFLFYEQKKLYHNGVLMMTSTMDLTDWTEPVMVLKEEFHLSYPWVFADNGHIYMIPETCGDGSIRLYEAADDSLTYFRFVKQLITQNPIDGLTMSFADTSVYKKKGIYYLHTSIGINHVNQLRLYFADNLFGPYTEHKDSPVSISLKYGRDAGCLFQYDGMLFRPAQDCELRYGDNVHLMKIEVLDSEIYRETLYKDNVLDTRLDFYKEGGHQFNIVEFKGYHILATDAKEYHSYYFNRLMHKLGKYR